MTEEKRSPSRNDERLIGIAQRLADLIPAKETHKAVTYDMGVAALNILQDNREAILAALRSEIGTPPPGTLADRLLEAITVLDEPFHHPAIESVMRSAAAVLAAPPSAKLLPPCSCGFPAMPCSGKSTDCTAKVNR